MYYVVKLWMIYMRAFWAFKWG